MRRIQPRNHYQSAKRIREPKTREKFLTRAAVINEHAELIHFELQRGGFAAAHAAIDRLEHLLRPERFTRVTPIGNLPLPAELAGILIAAGIGTVSDLLATPDVELLALPLLGPQRLALLRDLRAEITEVINEP